jgi:hypothetical protein
MCTTSSTANACVKILVSTQKHQHRLYNLRVLVVATFLSLQVTHAVRSNGRRCTPKVLPVDTRHVPDAMHMVRAAATGARRVRPAGLT